MITTLVFDLDDTLYKELDFVYGNFYKTAMFMMEQCPHLKDVGILDETLYEDMIQLLQVEGRGRIFNRIIEKYKLSILVKDIIDVYRKSKPLLNIYDDAEEILNWANHMKYGIGIITDGNSQVQHNKIDGLKLREKVNEVVVTYDFGEAYSKPHPKAYLHMLERFQCEPKQMIYIGDNPNKDFIGAKELGIYTVRIIRECGDHMQTRLDECYEADYEINTLIELKDIITHIDQID